MAASFTAERKAGTASAPGSSFVVVPASNGTAGSTLILIVVSGGLSLVVSTVVDTSGNTWHVDQTAITAGSQSVSVCSCYQGSGLTTSSSITVTLTASSSGGIAYWLEEFAGNYSTVDVFSSASTTSTSTTVATGTTAATTAADEIAVCGVVGQTATVTKNASYTLFPTGQQMPPIAGGMSDAWYRILTATGTQNGDGTASSKVTSTGLIATYKAAAAAAATKKPRVISSRVAAFRAAVR